LYGRLKLWHGFLSRPFIFDLALMPVILFGNFFSITSNLSNDASSPFSPLLAAMDPFALGAHDHVDRARITYCRQDGDVDVIVVQTTGVFFFLNYFPSFACARRHLWAADGGAGCRTVFIIFVTWVRRRRCASASCRSALVLNSRLWGGLCLRRKGSIQRLLSRVDRRISCRTLPKLGCG
jgi:hypothetical protein